MQFPRPDVGAPDALCGFSLTTQSDSCELAPLHFSAEMQQPGGSAGGACEWHGQNRCTQDNLLNSNNGGDLRLTTLASLHINKTYRMHPTCTYHAPCYPIPFLFYFQSVKK